MTKLQRIIKAKELLNISDRASMKEIKSNYRKMIRKWHPDKCNEPVEDSSEMTKKIIDAYKIIIDYCNNYKYSFEEEEVRKYLSEEDWWMDRFGHDPLWGKMD